MLDHPQGDPPALPSHWTPSHARKRSRLLPPPAPPLALPKRSPYRHRHQMLNPSISTHMDRISLGMGGNPFVMPTPMEDQMVTRTEPLPQPPLFQDMPQTMPYPAPGYALSHDYFDPQAIQPIYEQPQQVMPPQTMPLQPTALFQPVRFLYDAQPVRLQYDQGFDLTPMRMELGRLPNPFVLPILLLPGYFQNQWEPDTATPLVQRTSALMHRRTQLLTSLVLPLIKTDEYLYSMLTEAREWLDQGHGLAQIARSLDVVGDPDEDGSALGSAPPAATFTPNVLSESPTKRRKRPGRATYERNRQVFSLCSLMNMAQHMPEPPILPVRALPLRFLLRRGLMDLVLLGVADVPATKRLLVFKAYNLTCLHNGVKPLGISATGKLIKMLWPGLVTKRLGIRGNSKYHYMGIKLTEEVEALCLRYGEDYLEQFELEARANGPTPQPPASAPAVLPHGLGITSSYSQGEVYPFAAASTPAVKPETVDETPPWTGDPAFYLYGHELAPPSVQPASSVPYCLFVEPGDRLSQVVPDGGPTTFVQVAFSKATPAVPLLEQSRVAVRRAVAAFMASDVEAFVREVALLPGDDLDVYHQVVRKLLGRTMDPAHGGLAILKQVPQLETQLRQALGEDTEHGANALKFVAVLHAAEHCCSLLPGLAAILAQAPLRAQMARQWNTLVVQNAPDLNQNMADAVRLHLDSKAGPVPSGYGYDMGYFLNFLNPGNSPMGLGIAAGSEHRLLEDHLVLSLCTMLYEEVPRFLGEWAQDQADDDNEPGLLLRRLVFFLLRFPVRAETSTIALTPMLVITEYVLNLVFQRLALQSPVVAPQQLQQQQEHDNPEAQFFAFLEQRSFDLNALFAPVPGDEQWREREPAEREPLFLQWWHLKCWLGYFVRFCFEAQGLKMRIEGTSATA